MAGEAPCAAELTASWLLCIFFHASLLIKHLSVSGVGVAQLVEHWIVAPVVVGSNPIAHPPTSTSCKKLLPATFCPVVKIAGTFPANAVEYGNGSTFMFRTEMRISHGHGNRFVPEQCLHCGQIHTGHDKTTGEGVSQVVKGDVSQVRSFACGLKDLGNIPVWRTLLTFPISEFGLCSCSFLAHTL
jgi:hypothetical protein